MGDSWPPELPPGPEDELGVGRAGTEPPVESAAAALLAFYDWTVAGKARRAIRRLVGSGSLAALGLAGAAVAARTNWPGPQSATVLAGLLALLPLAVGIRYAGRAPGPGVAYLLGTGTSSVLGLVGLRVLVVAEPVSWPALAALAVLVAAPCWALAGWVARATWTRP